MSSALGCVDGQAAAVQLCHVDNIVAVRKAFGLQWQEVPRPQTHILVNGGGASLTTAQGKGWDHDHGRPGERPGGALGWGVVPRPCTACRPVTAPRGCSREGVPHVRKGAPGQDWYSSQTGGRNDATLLSVY
jgi:hypothetical protein